MPIKYQENLIGAWAFLIGMILAVSVGIFGRNQTNPLLLGILALLGLVAGYFVSEKEVQTFLLASVSLVIVSFAGIQGLVLDAAIRGIAIGRIVSSVLGALLVMFVPATIIVALKTVFSLAKK
ncbi:MAG: hypothetical protein KJ718_03965 [Nanoarchaeota archaeon]|nr:hypothetical protein [Nanoarchaeota archaeon]